MDGEAHETHRHFRATNGGSGTVTVENEIPWWKLSRYGSVRAVIREGLALQFAQGEGGDHYENLTNAHTEVACGIAVINSELTVTHDFR